MKRFGSYGTIALIVILGFSSLGIVISRLTDTIAAFSEARSGSQTTVVIDAGHGGEDGGAVSRTGVAESTLNLQIAIKLECLMGLLGYRTQMLRTDDTSLADATAGSYSEKKISDLKKRVEIINGIPEALLVSIHQNHFDQTQYRGAQVFYHNCPQSNALAQLTQENLRTALDLTNARQCKPADGIYLMEHIQCPGILVECGFLSNPDEERLLRDFGYQNKIAIAVAASVSGYLGEKVI